MTKSVPAWMFPYHYDVHTWLGEHGAELSRRVHLAPIAVALGHHVGRRHPIRSAMYIHKLLI